MYGFQPQQRTYSRRELSFLTNFPLTENPISERGRWFDEGINTGRTSVQTGALPGSGTGAFGTQGVAGAPPFLDSGALLVGFPNDCFIQATVASNAPAGDQELEILFRGNCDPGTGHYSGYECNLYLPLLKYSIVRLNPDDAHTFDFVIDNITTNFSMANGAVWNIGMVGPIITAKCNGLLVLAKNVTDITGPYLSTGLPGIGFYRDNSQGAPGNSNELAWTNLTAGAL